jgi:hypothetical protein
MLPRQGDASILASILAANSTRAQKRGLLFESDVLQVSDGAQHCDEGQ